MCLPEASGGTPSAARGRSDLVVGIAASIASTMVVVVLYVRSFGGPLHIFASDPFSYVWQFRALRAGLLDDIDPRPGAAALGALLEGSGIVPADLAPTLIGIALCAVLGLAIAALFLDALSLPAWAVLPVAIGAATFSGTGRLTGFLANLIALVCFSAGAAVFAGAPSSWTAFFLSSAAFLAAGLAHPGILPAWFAIVVGWLGLSVLAKLTGAVRHRDAGERPLDVRPALALGALTVGAVGTLAVVLGIMGRSLAELGDLELLSARFAERLLATWRQVAPLAPLIVAGSLIAVIRGWKLGRRSAQRLLLAWVAVCLAGVAVMLFAPGFPGHRTLMIAVPLGGAVGLVVTAIPQAAARVRGRGRALALVAGAGIGLGIALLSASWGLDGFREVASAPWRDRALPARQVAAFVQGQPADVPVVMVYEPRNPSAALFWKVRLNVTRSFLDARRATNLFMYVGDPRRLLEGEPTTFASPADELGRVLNGISERTWPDVDAALRDGAVLVFPHAYLAPKSWRFLKGRAQFIADGIAASGRTSAPSKALAAHASISPVGGWAAAVAAVVLLGAVGGGYALLASRGPGPSLVGVSPLAPAFGVVAVILAGTATALVGGDPGGAAGLLVLTIVGALGWVGAVRRRRRV